MRVISFATARLASLIRLAKNLPVDLSDSDDWMDDLLNEALTDDNSGHNSGGLPNDSNGFKQ